MPLATWIGPFDAFDANMQLVRVGDQREVTEGDLLSAHWQAVDAPPASAPTPASAPAPFSLSSTPSTTTDDGSAD